MVNSLPPILCSRPSSPPTRTAAVVRKNAKTVLVVEDDADLRRMLVKMLGATYTVYEATDGADALDMLGAILPPDLIVTDVMMPNVDGFMLIRRIKAHKALSRIPIVFLTAKTSAKDVVEGINAGARHYLTKPFKLADLSAKVTKILTVA